MKTIGIALNSVVGGPSTYATELVFALLKLKLDIQLCIFSDKKFEVPQELAHSSLQNIVITLPGKWAVPLWDHILLPFALLKHRVDLLHHTKGVVPLFFGRKTIVNIHDAAPLLFPETFSFFQGMYLRQTFKRAQRKASVIITGSRSAAADIKSALNVGPDRLLIIYDGAPAPTQPLDTDYFKTVEKKYALPTHYILYMGTIQPRKNIARLIEAYTLLKKEGMLDVELVLAGRLGWNNKQFQVMLNNQAEYAPVRYSGHIAEADKSYVYTKAKAFVSPSLYEGFGITILEAMHYGTPVIASIAGSLPEICGDAAILVDPLDTQALAQAIRSVLTDEAVRLSLIEKGTQRCTHFSWKKTAEATYAAYQKLLARSNQDAPRGV